MGLLEKKLQGLFFLFLNGKDEILSSYKQQKLCCNFKQRYVDVRFSTSENWKYTGAINTRAYAKCFADWVCFIWDSSSCMCATELIWAWAESLTHKKMRQLYCTQMHAGCSEHPQASREGRTSSMCALELICIHAVDICLWFSEQVATWTGLLLLYRPTW